ncbi:MAG: hypothetical protein M3R30_02160 [Candidatus Eremiobacteraeota bacterium]|nr:hypothetical protein [Candidatus Eremiobacteraeota bacterium]
MKLRALASMLTLAVACGGFAMAAPPQQNGALPHGGSYILRPDPSASTAAIALWFRVPSNGYDGASPGVAQLAAASCAAVRLSGGKSLADLVRSLGGRLVLGGEPDMTSIDVTVPAGSARRAIAALTAAYFAPNVDDASYSLGLRDSAVRGVERRYSAELALHDAMLAQMFVAGPAHVSPLPGSADVFAAIPISTVGAFAKRAFVSPNAVLSLTGSVDASLLDAVTDGDASASASAAPLDSRLGPSGTTTSVTGAVAGIAIGFVGPPIRDERASTALDFINDYLFAADRGVVTRRLADTKASVSGHFLTYHDPGVTIVSLSGGDLDASALSVRAAIAAMSTPLDAATFAAARRAFAYRSARNASTPGGLADDLAWYAVQGDASYAPGDISGTYARTLESLDPQFVADVARRYLRVPTVVHLVAEKGSAS